MRMDGLDGSSTEVLNEELYLLSPQAPPWRVAGLLYLFYGLETSRKGQSRALFQ
jgi:hypothetical protein